MILYIYYIKYQIINIFKNQFSKFEFLIFTKIIKSQYLNI